MRRTAAERYATNIVTEYHVANTQKHDATSQAGETSGSGNTFKITATRLHHCNAACHIADLPTCSVTLTPEHQRAPLVRAVPFEAAVGNRREGNPAISRPTRLGRAHPSDLPRD